MNRDVIKCINNLSIVLNNFDWNLKNENFYVISLMIRNKDHNNIFKKNSIQIRDYYVSSQQELLEKFDVIKYLCDSTWCRAYISTNYYNYENVWKYYLKYVTDQFLLKNFKTLKNSYTKSVFNSKREKKKWLVDIDDTSRFSQEYLCFSQYFKEHDISYFEVPTKNWYHLVCDPFDLKKFRETTWETCSNTVIHQNEYTLLYTSL